MADRQEILDKLAQCVIDLNHEVAAGLAQEALDAGINPIVAIEEGLTKGMNVISERFDDGDLFMPQMLIAATAFQNACGVLQGAMTQEESNKSSLGKVLFFTVEGDIHDIGKNIVKTMLIANNFEVIDLGRDVSADTAVAKAKEYNVDIIAGSALMTTTMPGQKEIVNLLNEEGIRDQYKVLFGGAPVTEAWCKQIGADGYSENAADAVTVAKKLVGK